MFEECKKGKGATNVCVLCFYVASPERPLKFLHMNIFGSAVASHAVHSPPWCFSLTFSYFQNAECLVVDPWPNQAGLLTSTILAGPVHPHKVGTFRGV